MATVHRVIRPLILAALLLGVATACGDKATPEYPDEVQLTDSDIDSSVKLALDGELIVALASNITTGFSWSVGEQTGQQLELQGEPRYLPPGSTTPVVGAAGTQVFTFEAKSTGTAKLVLEYKRPFEPGVAPAKTFSVTVEVR
jgi:inhibitor of cysteine peptidase